MNAVRYSFFCIPTYSDRMNDNYGLFFFFFSRMFTECFERVSIGKRLNRGDVSRSVANTTLKQCDVACERETCNAYAYG